MKVQKHHIRKQIIDLELSSQQDAFALQKKFSRLYQEEVLPQLDQLFSHLVGPEEILRIPKLEIDLGVIEKNKIDRDFVAQCLKSIEEEVRKQLYLARKSNTAEAQLITRSVAILEQFLFFLSQGKMKWNQSPDSWNGFEFEILSVLETKGETAIASAKEKLLADKIARQRLTNQFSSQFLERFFALLFKKEAPEINTLAQALKKAIPGDFSFSIAAPFYQLILEQVLNSTLNSSHTKLSVEQFTKTIQRKLGKNKADEWMPYLTKAINNINRTKQASWVIAIGKVLEQKAGEKSLATTKEAKQVETTEADKKTPQKSTESLSKEIEAAFKEGQLIQNAGLVILVPFLKTLFQELGYLEKNKFKDRDQQQRAIILTQYLVTGKEEIPEYEMTLNKFLCGWASNVPLDKFIRLTGEEKTEAHQLLQAVIKHWKAPGDISIESLQEGFLQRSGKFYLEQSKWRLLVERTTLDILVDRLPWTIGMCKLPWMKDMIYVDW